MMEEQDDIMMTEEQHEEFMDLLNRYADAATIGHYQTKFSKFFTDSYHVSADLDVQDQGGGLRTPMALQSSKGGKILFCRRD